MITNLPPDAIIEAPCYVDSLGIHMTPTGDLPLACAATCSASINVQRMAKEAAVHGDVTLLKQAMLHDPLVGAVCNTEEIWQMTDDMLVAQAQWLPQYRKATSRRPRSGWRGSWSRPGTGAGPRGSKVRSVAELLPGGEGQE